MKVLIGCHGFPPKQIAGAEWEAYRRARWLNAHGHTAQVLAIDEVDLPPGQPPRLEVGEVDGIQVHRLSYSLDQRPGQAEEYDNPVARRALAELLAAERPDIFHLISGLLLTGSALQAAHAADVPAVVTLTDFWFVCPRIVLRRSTGEVCRVPDDPLDCALCVLAEKRRYRLLYQVTAGQSHAALKALWRATGFAGFGRARQLNRVMIERRRFQAGALAEADQIITASRFLAEMVERQGVGERQIRVIRQGIGIQPQPRREAVPGRPLTFGYVGQIAEHKGVDLLVRAFRSLPYEPGQARLVIHGDPAKAWPPFWKKLRATIGSDERIEVAGPFAHGDAPRVYAGFDALVVPSIWYENSPNVILEAFACGVPVLAADLGGVAELVAHECNGYLFAAGDQAALAEALRRVIEQPQSLAAWRAAAPEVRTIEQEMDEIMEVYRRATGAARRRSLA